MVTTRYSPVLWTIPSVVVVCLLSLVHSASADSIVSWGNNEYGQAPPPQGNDFVAIAAGRHHSLALRSDGSVGGLVGSNLWGTLTNCYSTIIVSGRVAVGGLVGSNAYHVSFSYSNGAVSGSWNVGGLVGINQHSFSVPFDGIITECYSTCTVDGITSVGGLLGWNTSVSPYVCQCYSTGAVNGDDKVGGLVGESNYGGISMCYSTSTVSGNENIGGLMGYNSYGDVTYCYNTGMVNATGDYVGGLVGMDYRGYGTFTSNFLDMETSGQITSDGGTGKTTAEMQTASTFLEAGWDFVDETANGTEDIWWILEGKDYPRLWWEAGNN